MFWKQISRSSGIVNDAAEPQPCRYVGLVANDDICQQFACTSGLAGLSCGDGLWHDTGGGFSLGDHQATASGLVPWGQFQSFTQAGLSFEGVGDHAAQPEPCCQVVGIACQNLLQQGLCLWKLSILGCGDGPLQEFVKCSRTVIDRSLHGSP